MLQVIPHLNVLCIVHIRNIWDDTDHCHASRSSPFPTLLYTAS